MYLDLEDDILLEMGTGKGTTAEAIATDLVEAVKGTLMLWPSSQLFEYHRSNATDWWLAEDDSQPPPFLALLGFFSLVAERMASSEGFRSSNYYGRLGKLLDLPGDPKHVQSVVQRSYEDALFMWRLYNDWITESEGRRGKPTAFAFDYRVRIGLPMSQAVVRSADRRGLTELFVTFRLQPGQTLSRSDMQRLLEEWLPNAPVSVGLKTLCRDQDALERVTDVACVALQAWDGAVATQDHDPQRLTSPVLLTAGIYSTPRRSVELGLSVRTTLPMPIGDYKLDRDAAAHAAAAFPRGAWLEEARADGWHDVVADDGSIADLLFAHVELRRGDALLRREARRLVVLEWDQEQCRFIEVPRAHLGREMLLIVVDRLDSQLAPLIESCAREGWERLTPDLLPGLPNGWVAYSQVELLAVPDTVLTDLAALVPVAWTEVSLGGGLKLPARATWMRGHPPEVRVTSLADEANVAVMVINDEAEEGAEAAANLGTLSGAGIFSLESYDLDNGNYTVAIAEQSEGRILASTSFRIRSGSSPRPLAGDERTQVGHALDGSAAAMLTAAVIDDDRAANIGATILGTPGPGHVHRTTAPPQTLRAFVTEPVDDVLIETPTASAGPAPDCLETGAHHILLPDAGRNRPAWDAKIEGTCKLCGIEKFFPSRPRGRWGRRRTGTGRGGRVATQRMSQPQGRAPLRSPVQQRVKAPPILPAERADYDLLLAALTYAQRGSWESFEGVARHIADTPWFPLEVAATLSALGHIEVILNPRSLRPEGWTIAPPTLATRDDRVTAFLAGARTPELVSALSDAAASHGGICEISAPDGGPARVTVTGVEAQDLQVVAQNASEKAEMQMILSVAPAQVLGAWLISLGELARALPTFTPPALSSLERWDVESNKWLTVSDAGEPGAYRSKTLPRRYGFKSAAVSGTLLTRGDVRSVKWMAAAEAGLALMAYEETSRTLTCPLGAELPGLYARAAVLSSGEPPIERKDGTVTYEGVPADVAEMIWSCLQPSGTALLD